MANKSNLGLRLLIVVAILVAGGIAVRLLLRPVAKVAIVTKGPAVNAVPGSIIIRAEKITDLKSEVGGRILTSQLALGKLVQEGDLLVQIDTGDLDLEIARLESEYKAKQDQLEVGSAIELELESAKDSLIFYERQATRGQIAPVELDKRRRDVKSIEQKRELEKIANQLSLASYKNSLLKDARQKDKMSIRAPFDGQVTAEFAYKGALIGGNERIGTLITTARLVEAKISEENFSGIKLGQKASVTFLGGAGGKSPDWIYDAKVSKILPTADPDTQRYIVYLDVEIPVDDLIPGKTGEVTIVVGQHEAKAIVPRRALVGNTLYVIKDSRVEIRKVSVGYTWLTGAEVTKGLEAGEEVILENQDTFRDGQQVRVQRAETPVSAKAN